MTDFTLDYSVTEEEFKARGVNIVIYVNQLTRTGFPAMQNAAKMILENHRAKECEDICMPFKEIMKISKNEMSFLQFTISVGTLFSY